MKNTILIIDDDDLNREIIKKLFNVNYDFKEAVDGLDGINQLRLFKNQICAVILDLKMPNMDGMDVLKVINKDNLIQNIPVFIVTSYDDNNIINKAYELGVMDVLNKPINALQLKRRVENVIDLYTTKEKLNQLVETQDLVIKEKIKEIEELNLSTIEALATAIEFRDSDSGNHVNRLYSMTKYMLENTEFGVGFTSTDIENISRASILHDIGKISISDIILNKPARLTSEEFEIMKTHTIKGEEFLLSMPNMNKRESYMYALDIARHHHERYDGTGYPDGLKGDEISIPAQIVSILDVYDALVNDRVYKKALSHEIAVEMIKNGICGAFNPLLLEEFLRVEPVFRNWYININDSNINENDQLEKDVDFQTDIIDNILVMLAIQQTCDLIISVNLSKNTYHIIDYARFKTHKVAKIGNFDECIMLATESIPPCDKEQFYNTFNRQNLLEKYYEGCKQVVLYHQQYGDDGIIRNVVTTVMFVLDGKTGDVHEITISKYLE